MLINVSIKHMVGIVSIIYLSIHIHVEKDVVSPFAQFQYVTAMAYSKLIFEGEEVKGV